MSVGLILFHRLMVDRRHISFLSRNNVLPDNFRDKEKRVFEFLTEHASEYGILPHPETVERSLEFSFPDYPDEPIEYWVNRLRTRQESRLIADGTNAVRELLNEGKLSEARDTLKSTVSEIEVINPSSHLFPLHVLGKEILVDTQDRQMSGGIKGISFGLPYMDEVTDGAQGGDSIAICGRPGCLAAETKLYFSRKGKGNGRWYTVEDAYHKFNGIPRKGGWRSGLNYLWDQSIPTLTQCLKDDGLTGLHEVADIVVSGFKTLFRVTTETGKNIRVTAKHPFRVPEGTEGADAEGFIELRDLSLGDYVICKAPDKKGRGRNRIPKRARVDVCGVKYHPNAKKKVVGKYEYLRIPRNVLAYEAHRNNLAYADYVSMLCHDPTSAEKFWFVPKGMEIHHKDCSRRNDVPENLEMLTQREHARRHQDRSRIGKNYVQVEKITRIDKCEVAQTYDIAMKTPFHNYVANGFVVHNSGKTYVMSKAVVAGYLQDKVPMVVTMEMSAKQLARRQLGLLQQVSVTQIRLGRLSHWGEQKLRNGIVSLETEHENGHPFYILQGNLMTTVEDVGNYAKEMRPDVLYVDGAYLLMSNLKFGSKWERISHTAEYLKSLALTLDIPVIATYQFNRKGGGSLANIGGADSVGQLASIVIGIETESDTEEGSVGGWSSVDYKILEFLKGREGEKGKVRIMFDTERTVIEQDEVIIDEAVS